jgi:GTP-dependent phosphoenolpyruvate carboxykinase
VDAEGWKHQIPQIHAHYAKFGPTLPAKLHDQLQELEQRLS